MIVEFDRSFEKSLDKIKNKALFPKIEKIIINCENSKSLTEIPNVKKLAGYKTYYRIKIGEHRKGFKLIGKQILRFILIAHRKDIYRSFPR